MGMHGPPSLQAASRGQKQGSVTEADPSDPLASQYGDVELVQSQTISGSVWTTVERLTPSLEGTPVRIVVEGWPGDVTQLCRWIGVYQANVRRLPLLQVLVRARVQTVRGKGKSAFIVLRQELATVQAVLFVDDSTVSKGMVKYASAITRESVVDIAGVCVRPLAPVEGCSQSEVGRWKGSGGEAGGRSESTQLSAPEDDCLATNLRR